LGELSSRVVVPLASATKAGSEELPRLKPKIEIDGKAYILMTTDIGVVPVASLGKLTGNIEDEYRYTITTALAFNETTKDRVEARGLKQVTDTGAIEKIIDEIIAANPKQVEMLKDKPKTFGWFVGQVMKAMQGKGNPQAVNEILKKKLGVE